MVKCQCTKRRYSSKSKIPTKALTRRRHRQWNGGTRYIGKNSNDGKNGIIGKSDKIGTDPRNGTNEHRPVELPMFGLQISLSVSCFFGRHFAYRHHRMPCTRRCVKTEHLTRRSTHVLSRCAQCSAVFFICSRFHPALALPQG